MADQDLRFGLISFPHECGNGGAEADAFAVPFGGENGGVGVAFGGELAGFAAVAIHAIKPKPVEMTGEALAHDDIGGVAEVGEVGDEGDDAAAAVFGDAFFGEAEEADIEFIEIELLDLPFGGQAFFVRLD